MTAPILPPIGPSWTEWAQQISRYLRRQMPNLFWKSPSDIPTQNGTILWDEVNKYPVVAKNNVWRQIVLADGHGVFFRSTSQAAAVIDTPYAIVWSGSAYTDGISIGSPASRIVITEGGTYEVSFSAQVLSSSSSSKSIWFWPRVNGVDVAGSTIKQTISAHGETSVVSRAAMFEFAAGDYIESMFAVSSTSIWIDAPAATAFAPASPSATFSILRVIA